VKEANESNSVESVSPSKNQFQPTSVQQHQLPVSGVMIPSGMIAIQVTSRVSTSNQSSDLYL